MKNLLIILLLGGLLSSTALAQTAQKSGEGSGSASAEIEWLTIDEAQARNAEEPRPFFVDVYTDWCGWCKRMDKDTFSDADVAAYVNENFYAVKLDAESSTMVNYKGEVMSQTALAREWGVRGYPTIVLIDEDLYSPQAKPGYRKPAAFLSLLRTFKD